jgi:hypothetical protein
VGLGLSPVGAAITGGETRAGAPAPGDASNLALRRPVLGSTPCRADEGGAKAVNGSVAGGHRDKWCSTAATKTLQVDLGVAHNLTSFVVRHAQAGGERAAWNTRDYDIQVSNDGNAWTTVAQVRGNTANVSTHTVGAVNARHVRVNVLVPTSSTDSATRIYEIEVYRQ